MRARSSRRWSESTIRPSSPTGWAGFPERSRYRPLSAKSAVVLVGLGVLGPGRLLRGRRKLGGGRRDGRRRGRLVLLVVAQALGLGLEDAERLTGAPGQV